MESNEVFEYEIFAKGLYIPQAKAELNTNLSSLLYLIESDIDDITGSEFVETLDEAIQSVYNLKEDLLELSERFFEAKNYLAKADKKWEEDV